MSLVVTALYNGSMITKLLCPLFCFLNHERSKSLMTVFRQNYNSAKHHAILVYGIQPTSGNRQIVINNYNILCLWRIMLVKFSI